MTGEPGRVALVTGGGSGVGRGIALALAADGVTVAVAGRTAETLAETARLVTERAGTAQVVVGDVVSTADTDRMVAEVLAAHGRLDIVVHAAQSLSYGSLRRTTEEQLEAAWQSGPMGAFRLMTAALPALRERQGLVVTVASGAGITAPPAMGAYAMVKEAMRTLSRVAAVEWGPSGVRVVTLCPLAATPGMDRFGAELGVDTAVDLVAQVPLRRMGDPEADIGGVVVFLASPAGRYITGTTLMVDGGYTYLR